MASKKTTPAQIESAYMALSDAEKIRRLEQRACAYIGWFIDLDKGETPVSFLMKDMIKYEEEWK